MATIHRFAPDNSLPLFLSHRAEEPERSLVMKIAVVTTIVFVLTAAAIAFAIAGNPLTLLANAKASQVSTSPQVVAVPPTPTIQPTALPASPASARIASMGDELITAFKNAFETQAEIDQPPAGDLFNQFQAWAADEEAQAHIRPPQPVRDARAQVVQKARLPLPKPRPIQSEQTARVKDSSLAPVRGFGWRD